MKPTPRSKAALVDLNDIGKPSAEPRPPRQSIGTAPGQAAQNSLLRSELEKWEGANPVRHLDPKTVLHSDFANRHEESYRDEEFAELKAAIENTGGNVQPIKVRPHPNKPDSYELVYGHRRHRACLELGIPVLAMVAAINDEQLFVEMDLENRARKNLRPYELGAHFERGLAKGVRPTLRELAALTGHNIAVISQALAIVRLPQEVLDAFTSPLDIQYRWASDLANACKDRLPEILETARVIKKLDPRPSAAEVFERLTRPVAETDTQSSAYQVKLAGGAGQKCTLIVDPAKNSIRVNVSHIDTARAVELEELLKRFIG